METIKIDGTQFELVPDGYQLGNGGGQVIFRPGAASFDSVEALLAGAKSITVLDDAGEPLVSRSDLVYAGRLAKDTSYTIGADQVGTVLIAQFRAPDLREKYAELEAQLQYVAMMTGTEMEV